MENGLKIKWWQRYIGILVGFLFLSQLLISPIITNKPLSALETTVIVPCAFLIAVILQYIGWEKISRRYPSPLLVSFFLLSAILQLLGNFELIIVVYDLLILLLVIFVIYQNNFKKF